MQKSKKSKRVKRPYMVAATTRRCEAWQRFREAEDRFIEQIDKRRSK